jgi:hypothetical protein
MSTLPPLLKAQFDDGLRVRRPKPTQDFYKHIYINSDDRVNKSDKSSDCQVNLQQPIECPPDGTTFIRLHRASIPFTFYNIVKATGFRLSMYNGTAHSEERKVVLYPGFYNMNTLLAAMNDSLANTGNFSSAGPNFGQTNVYVVRRTSSNFFQAEYTGAAFAGKWITITFMDFATFNGVNNWITPMAYDLKLLTKRTVGYDDYPLDVTPVLPTGTKILTSSGIFGPFQEIEVFLRITGVPINYDLIDAKTGAPSDILAVVPLNVDTFGSVMSLGKDDSLSYVLPPNAKVQRLILKLTYRDAQDLVDLQGQDFSCIISIIKENSDASD